MSFNLNFKVGDLFINKDEGGVVYEVLHITDNSIKFTDKFTWFRVDFSVKEQLNWLENCEIVCASM